MALDDNPQVDPSVLELIKRATPKWLDDGLGVRGNPIPRNTSSEGSLGFTASGWQDSNLGSGDPPQLEFGGSTSVDVSSPSFPPQTSKQTKFPYQGVLTADSNGQDHVSINYNSDLYRSFAPEDTITITGLDTNLSVNSGDIVWLEISMDPSGEVTRAQIMTTATGSFDINANAGDENAYVEYVTSGGNTKVQSRARKLLVSVDSDDNGNTILNQYVFTSLILQSYCINGVPAKYPVPY
jgi:hypothetical protein